MAIRPWINGLSLYTGNGGLEAALHLVLPGYRTICAVERQAYAAAAFVGWLEKAGLGACPVWDDAATFDPIPWRGLVDIVSAGFPCQPYSAAGKGLRESDPRDGWPHVFRTVRALMPPIFWGENVAAIVTRGRHSFKSDLESLGYRVAARIGSAAEVGAPHLRERLFILGTLADGNGSWKPQPQGSQPESGGRSGHGRELADSRRLPSFAGPERPRRETGTDADRGYAGAIMADTARHGRPEPEGQQGRSHASFGGSGILADSGGRPDDKRPDVQGRRQEGGTSSCRAGQVGNPNGAELQGRPWKRRAVDITLAGWPWPAGRGAEQYAWEKPRLIESGMGRTTHGVGARNEQLLNLGNGVVPVAGALAFVALWQELMACE